MFTQPNPNPRGLRSVYAGPGGLGFVRGVTDLRVKLTGASVVKGGVVAFFKAGVRSWHMGGVQGLKF